MSMNYYFVPTNKAILEQQKNDAIEAVFTQFKEGLLVCGFSAEKIEAAILRIRHQFYTDIPQIHIGKRSLGWAPLLHANEHFHSMETLKGWYEQHAHAYHIENEYGEQLTWEELDEELFQWIGQSFLTSEAAPFYYKDPAGQEWTYDEFS